MFIKKLLTIAMVTMSVTAFAQNVGVNTDGSTPDNSAMLDIKSTDKGVLIPRMSMTDRNLIALPATGLLVYQTDNTPGFYYNSGTPIVPAWTMVASGGAVQGTVNGLLIGQGTGNPSVFGPASTAANQFLQTPTAGGVPTWTTPSDVTGSAVVNVTNGTGQTVGTGNLSLDVSGAAGGVLYGTGSSSSFSGAGNTGDVLVSSGAGAPVWAAPNTTLTTSSITGTGVVAVTNGGGQTVGSGNASLDVVGTSGGVLYGTGTSSAFTAPSTGANQVLATPTMGGNPSWVNANTTLTTNNITPATSSAVVVTNGNNQVVGATPVTVDVQGTAGGVMYGTGAAPATFTPAGTAGQYLRSTGANAPTWVNPVSYFSVPTNNGGNAAVANNFTMSGGYVTWSTSGSPYTNTITTQLVASGSFYQATSNVNFLRTTGSISLSAFGAGTFNVVLVKYSSPLAQSCGALSNNFNLTGSILGSCTINFGANDISGKWDIDLSGSPVALAAGDYLTLMVQNATGTTRTWYGCGTSNFSVTVQ